MYQENWTKDNRIHADPPRAKSAFSVGAYVPAIPSIPVKLYIFGEHRKTIEVPENISKVDPCKRASHEFQSRVAIQPEVFPIKANSAVICSASFVPEIGGEDIPVP
jgi:hypothetical protein